MNISSSEHIDASRLTQLDGLQLADPIFHTYGPIDNFVGFDLMNQLFFLISFSFNPSIMLRKHGAVGCAAVHSTPTVQSHTTSSLATPIGERFNQAKLQSTCHKAAYTDNINRYEDGDYIKGIPTENLDKFSTFYTTM